MTKKSSGQSVKGEGIGCENQFVIVTGREQGIRVRDLIRVRLSLRELPRFANSRKIETICRTLELRRSGLARWHCEVFDARRFVILQCLKMTDHRLNKLQG